MNEAYKSVKSGVVMKHTKTLGAMVWLACLCAGIGVRTVSCKVPGVPQHIQRLCPFNATLGKAELKIEGYLPSYNGQRINDIEIIAVSPIDVVMQGPLYYSFSRDFEQIRNEVGNNQLLKDITKYNYETCTLACTYQVGQLKVELKNDVDDIIVCPPLEDFKVGFPLRTLQVKSIEAEKAQPLGEETLFKYDGSGKQIIPDHRALNEDEALVYSDGQKSSITPLVKVPLTYRYVLEKGNFSGLAFSHQSAQSLIKTLLSTYSLTDMSFTSKENETVVSCTYKSKESPQSEVITRMTVNSQECRLEKGKTVEENVVVCKRRIQTDAQARLENKKKK